MISRVISDDSIDVDEYLKEYTVSSLPLGADPVSFYSLYKKHYDKFPDIEDESEEATKAYRKMMDDEDKMLRVMFKSFIEYLMEDGYIVKGDK